MLEKFLECHEKRYYLPFPLIEIVTLQRETLSIDRPFILAIFILGLFVNLILFFCQSLYSFMSTTSEYQHSRIVNKGLSLTAGAAFCFNRKRDNIGCWKIILTLSFLCCSFQRLSLHILCK
ncbi:hypothetical protein Anas_05238 [Armadillidium nasatum]|uniref:Uncharacterized protein n=1 Tax=Armadillidium nasatum TaxID=96803 RepID=A0A5N5SUK6_9CRUS|nr:hypothetical protein Anas_05238 [Armadillidium nasatum]